MSSSEDVLLSESVLLSPSPEAQPTTAPKAPSAVIQETLNSQPDTMAIINETHRHCHDRSDATFSARAAWIQAQEPAPQPVAQPESPLARPPNLKVPPKAPQDDRLGRQNLGKGYRGREKAPPKLNEGQPNGQQKTATTMSVWQ